MKHAVRAGSLRLLQRAALALCVWVLATALTAIVYARTDATLLLRVARTAGLWYLNVALLGYAIHRLVGVVTLERIPKLVFFAIQIVAAFAFAGLWTGMAWLDLRIYADPAIESYLRTMSAQYFNIGLYVYAAVAGWLYSARYHRRVRDQAVREVELIRLAREAELRALKAQINPHFLFNTLNAVNALAGKDTEAVRALNARLASVLRYALDGFDQDLVTLGQELDFVRDYLAIEQVRFGSRLAVTLEVDGADMRWRIPPMILQPLVENAVKHGVAPREEGGFVRLSIFPGERSMRFEIADDGAGPPTTDLEFLVQRGLGLRNTLERLRAHYGTEGSLRIEAGAGRGCSVILELPLEDTRGVPDRRHRG